MSEKRGYPNPNYTEEDIMTEEEMEELLESGLVPVDADHYEELVAKAAALDILASHIKSTGHVNEAVVKAVTGTVESQEMVPKKEVDSVWGYYQRVSDEKEKLKNELASMKKAREELIEILRQNNIGPYAEGQEEQEGNG